MKKKCLTGLLLALFIVGFTGCNDDDDKHNKGKLPGSAQTFIETLLKGYDILDVKEVDDKGDELNEKYIVTFSDDVLVSFSSMGYWRRIKSNSELPESLLELIPFGGAAELKKTYPIVTINEINHKLYGYQAVMSNGVPAAFYDIDSSNTFGLDITDEKSLWPNRIEDFLGMYHAEYNKNQSFYLIKDKDAGESKYRFGTSDGTKVHFDKQGDWYNYEKGSDPLRLALYEACLPQVVRDVIEQTYKGSASGVHAMLRHDNYFQAVFKHSKNSEAVYLLFDIVTNEPVEALNESTRDFLKTYVGEPSEGTTFNIRMLTDSEQIIFRIEGGANGAGAITLFTDTSRRMLQLSLNGAVIPKKILDYLPEKVKKQAEENYADKDIMGVINGLAGVYCILYKDGSRLDFDKDGNVVG